MDTEIKVLFDLTRVIRNEPRIRDLDLATGLRYEVPNRIRGLIHSLLPDLRKLGEVSTQAVETSSPSGGRPSTTFWLNEPQAYLVCASARTPRAAEFRLLLVRVFMLYKRGLIAPRQASLETTIVDAQIGLYESTVLQAPTWAAPLVTGIQEMRLGIGNIAQTATETKHIVEAAHSDIMEIKNTQDFKRADVTGATLELHIRCLHVRRCGVCPCCETRAILDQRGVKTAEFTIDHWWSRNKNKPAETWPVCAECNQKLLEPKFKATRRSQFDSYQFALSKYLEAEQPRLFGGDL
jgi:hypothetical protein